MRYFILIVLLQLSVSICAQVDTFLLSVDLDDVVVTAQYAPTEARNAVHKVDVISQESWREQGVNDLSELLQRQLTMNVNPDPILGNGLTIQGLGGQNVQIMIDGVPVVGRLGGEIDLTQLNLDRFSRVEIITGAMSARYGSDAAGGVINLITSKELEHNWRFSANGQYETVGLHRQQFRVGRKLGHFQLDGGLNLYDAQFGPEDSLRQGSTPWNPKDQVGYDLNFRYRPTDSLQLHYGYQRFTEELRLLGEVRRPQFRPYVVDQLFTTVREDHALGGSYWVSPRVIAELTAGWNTFDRDKATARRDVEPDTTSLVPGEQDTTNYSGQLVRLSFATVTDQRLSGQIGVEYRRETGSGGRILDPDTQNREPAMSNLAAWVGLRYDLRDHLTLEATTRFGRNNRYDHPVVPALHLLWRPSAAWRWRVGYAAGFRAPSVQELFFNFIDVNHFIVGNQALLAERSHNLQAHGQWTSPRIAGLDVSGSLFYNRIRNRITLADVDDGRFSYVNLEEYETHGLTLQLAYEVDDRLFLNLGGALTRLSNPAAERAESAVPQFVNLGEVRTEISYRILKTNTTLRLDHRYVGRRDRYQIGADGSVTQGFVGDFHLLHLTANQRLWANRITLTTGVKNLLNRDRVPVTGGNGGGAHAGGDGGQLIDFGRSAFLGIRLEL
ncbi:TonB-dependent siderophore receptor [Lewinella sp. W8]|uniref:TonB-dependent receptor plug domain-containing protein n=1 Tax=Lewinella sp. W8 TaxID=2528208 RepID=UPI001068B05E|nr:TonB-dependent receptor [Lewinella sp. W8]MTB53146.1 TonB-dependent receptor [Lewinella sp. W8]